MAKLVYSPVRIVYYLRGLIWQGFIRLGWENYTTETKDSRGLFLRKSRTSYIHSYLLNTNVLVPTCCCYWRDILVRIFCSDLHPHYYSLGFSSQCVSGIEYKHKKYKIFGQRNRGNPKIPTTFQPNKGERDKYNSTFYTDIFFLLQNRALVERERS